MTTGSSAWFRRPSRQFIEQDSGGFASIRQSLTRWSPHLAHPSDAENGVARFDVGEMPTDGTPDISLSVGDDVVGALVFSVDSVIVPLPAGTEEATWTAEHGTCRPARIRKWRIWNCTRQPPGQREFGVGERVQGWALPRQDAPFRVADAAWRPTVGTWSRGPPARRHPALRPQTPRFRLLPEPVRNQLLTFC